MLLPLLPDASLASVAVAPFLAALLAPLLQRFAGSLTGWILALVPAGIFAFLLRELEPIAGGEVIRQSLAWIPAYDLALSFRLDGLSLTFALLIAGIGTLIFIYSAAYLKGHPHQGRFLAFLLLFLGAMLGLVLADNMVAFYAFWELTSVTSFLLIGFDHARQAARRAAIQALVVTNVGGLAFLVAAVLLRQVTGTWDFSALPGVQGEAIYPVALGLVALAAFTKSAQLPFHFWLPNAMEAPTPVSAFLHSATMVQGGVYLLARMSPALGGSGLWTGLLTAFGAVTLIWGSLMALRQTDLKQMLAQTTIASLGLLILLLGVGSEAAVTAAIAYFIAHALYKATLFLVVGVIDHETGVRDITALGGLREKLAVAFIATILAAFSMLGLPAAVGFLAKEGMYGATFGAGLDQIVLLIVLLGGNAVLGAVAIAMLVRPYLGPLIETPQDPHEGPLGMLIGPVVLGVLGIAGGVMVAPLTQWLIDPAASAVVGHAVHGHFALAISPTDPLLWLSVATWVLGGLVYLRLDAVRKVLRRVGDTIGWTFDVGFDAAMFALIRVAGAITRAWHHGRLELYLVVVFSALAGALLLPLLLVGGVPAVPLRFELELAEWAVLTLAALGLAAVLAARTRLVAIVSLGIQGFAVALTFLLFGAPDLSFTQFMVEFLSVVILALVMTRLRLNERDPRELEGFLRDSVIAVSCGLGVGLSLLAVLTTPLDDRLSRFFAEASVPIAHGRNIVNVILVDFRGLDTLGEIAVVMTAGIAILALIRKQRPSGPVLPAAARRRRRGQTARAGA